MELKNVKIKSIKSDVSANGKNYYKLFFEELNVTINGQERLKLFFVWPNYQAHEMLKESVFKEGDTVNATYKDSNGYFNIEELTRVVSDSEPSKKSSAKQGRLT